MSRLRFPIDELVRLSGGFVLSVLGKTLWYIASFFMVLVLPQVWVVSFHSHAGAGVSPMFTGLMVAGALLLIHLAGAGMHFAGEELLHPGEMPLPFRQMVRWWGLRYGYSIAACLVATCAILGSMALVNKDFERGGGLLALAGLAGLGMWWFRRGVLRMKEAMACG